MKIWCVIPVYNHAETLVKVVARAKAYLPVVVVDDGSTDLCKRHLHALDRHGARLVQHERNRGKGAAIQTALKLALQEHIDYIIALDADGQHFPEDLPKFINAIENTQEETLFIGCRDFPKNAPSSSRFGRNFANFWLKIESGANSEDCQSGFRAYPVEATLKLGCNAKGYAFEAEVLPRAVWGGIKLQDIPIQVLYPKHRVTHFNKLWDNLRLTAIHAFLVIRRLIPWPAKWVVQSPRPHLEILPLLRHPWRSFKELSLHDATPTGLAAAAAVGTFIAVLPIFGLHTVVILYAASRLHLNQVMATSIQHLFATPIAPFICIETGYYLQHHHFLTELSLQTTVKELHLRFLDWLLGSLVLAPIFAAFSAGVVFSLARMAQQRLNKRPAETLPPAVAEAPPAARPQLLSSTRGNSFGFAFFRFLLKCFGLRVAGAFIWPVTFFYALFDRTAARRAAPVLSCCYPGASWIRRFWHTWRLFTNQGRVILLTNYLALTGKDIPIELESHPDAHPLLHTNDTPVVVVNSHFGGWQPAFINSHLIHRTITFMDQPDQKPSLNKFQTIRAKEGQVSEIVKNQDPAGGLLMAMDALGRKEMVGMM
ncbi:MAG: DUF2062 domain-containing protein [Victivallales bacterium]|nr:DUF2062 domain-containing protein [Victivallales bacterium]